LYYRIAEDRLKERIGARVTESDLLRRYRVSRTRLSVVLTRMAHEGWLERLPGHGWAFLPMLDSVKGYEEGYRFRALIEPAALRQPGYRIAAETLERLRRQQQDLLDHGERYTDAQLFEIGARPARDAVGASGNPFLSDALRRVNALRRLLEYRAKRDRRTIARQVREHLELIELVRKGRLEQAARFLERHLDIARKSKSPLVARPR
jgi:DNA-binding GntR family transcriptional regulator